MIKTLAFSLLLTRLLQAQVEYSYPIDSGGPSQDAVSIGEEVNTIYTFTVAENETISRVRLRLAASHTFVTDMGVVLKSPDGTIVRLFSGIGTDGGYFNSNTYFNDVIFEASASEDIGRPELGNDLGTNTGPWSGPYLPELEGDLADYLLSSFRGLSSAGTWQLIVSDSDLGDTGYIYAEGDDTNVLPTPLSRFSTTLGTALFIQYDTPPSLSPIAEWRYNSFGTPANSGSGSDMSDWDQDGLSNLLEYALDRDPKSSLAANGSSAQPTSSITFSPDQFIFSMDLPVSPPTDVLYQVHCSENLQDWVLIASKSEGEWLPEPEYSLTETLLGSERERVEFSCALTGYPKRMFRLIVGEAP